MIMSRAVPLGLLAASSLVMASSLAGQPSAPSVSRSYGRSVVEVGTARAEPGEVLGIAVRNPRWSSANTLLDGRRGSLTSNAGRLFGMAPVALDTEPGDHKLSLYFPGGRGRGGATTLTVPVSARLRPGRVMTLSPEGRAAALSQEALGHGRFLLAVIRTRDAQAYQMGPLRPPVDQPISFPFGGLEDFGMVMGPQKDGAMGEQHRGVDYAVPVGTEVKAPGLGIVILARSLAFSGETVAINHGNGLVSVLAHLTHVNVAEGEVVTEGAVVGTSGQTGFGALIPHLCFSVYLHSVNVDPEAVMDGSLWPNGGN